MLLYVQRSSTVMHLSRKLDLNSSGCTKCLIEFQSSFARKRFMLFSKLVYTTAPSVTIHKQVLLFNKILIIQNK